MMNVCVMYGSGGKESGGLCDVEGDLEKFSGRGIGSRGCWKWRGL